MNDDESKNRNHSIKKNLGLQTAYQVLSACMPLITAPYLARVLGATQLGIFSYTSSIVAYYTLFAMIGTVNYGTRCIATVKSNRLERNDVFSNIFALQIITTLTCILGYFIYIAFVCKDNIDISALQGIALIGCLLDINWLFFGVEDFQITVTRNIIIKILTVALILLFVRNENDLWIYTIIMLGGTVLSNLILFFYLPRYVSIEKPSWSKIKSHVIPNLVVFVPLLAMSVYHIMDKTMLGKLSTYEQSGFYYNSDKIVQIPLLVFNGIGTVMLPRMSSLIADDKKNEAVRLFEMTLEGVVALSIAIACGIGAVSKEFVPLFFGSGYDECIYIIIVFSPILLIKGLSIIVRTQFLIPMKMEKEFTKSVVGGALVNLVLNIVLIPKYGALGAAIATVLAELVACILQFKSIIGQGINLKILLSHMVVYLFIGVLMTIIVRITSLISVNSILKLAIEVISGAVFYGMSCFFYWKKTNNSFINSVYEPLFKKFIRR